MFLPNRLSSEPDELRLGRISPRPQRSLLLNDFFPARVEQSDGPLRVCPQCCWGQHSFLTWYIVCSSPFLLDHEQLSELIHLIRTLSNGAKRLFNGSRQTTCIISCSFSRTGLVACHRWCSRRASLMALKLPCRAFSSAFIKLYSAGGNGFLCLSFYSVLFFFLPSRFCQVLVQNVVRFPLVLPGRHITPK